MITDVQLAALSNWLGSIGMVLIVVYHVSLNKENVEVEIFSTDVIYFFPFFSYSPSMQEGQKQEGQM